MQSTGPVAVLVALGAALVAILRRNRPARSNDEGQHHSYKAVTGTVKEGKSTEVVTVAASTPALPAQVPDTTTPILQLFQSLQQAFKAEKARGYVINFDQPPESFARLNAAVRRLIGQYVEAGNDDWRKYANYSNLHYVRNLIDENEDFELMVICWKHGQGSRVHNHADSHGWVTVLEGMVTEDRYEPADLEGSRHPSDPPPLPGVLSTSTPCPGLTPTDSATAGRGTTLYLNDKQALHAVRCAAGSPGIGAVTLHLYSPPIRRVRLYEPELNRVIERTPGFFTVRGRKA